MTPIRALAFILPFTGIALQTWIVGVMAEGGVDGFLVGWWIYAILPYLACGLALYRLASIVPGILGSLVALAVDAAVYVAVFVTPSSSTAAIALLFSPTISMTLALITMGLTQLVVRYLRHRRARPLAPIAS